MKSNIITISAMLLLAFSACKTGAKMESSPKETAIGDNSRNSLDWAGTYKGIITGSDKGMETAITVNNDGTFVYMSKYKDSSDKILTDKGEFKWDKTGSIITLDGNNISPVKFRVGENRLIRLDAAGKAITGNSTDNFILIKVPEGITEKYWKLVEINGEKVVVDGIGSRAPYMILKQEDNRVNGNGGCNSFFGSYTLEDGNRIKFSQLGATQMACISNAEIEPKFFKVLEMADNYNLKGDTLTLNRARMAPLARFEAVYLY